MPCDTGASFGSRVGKYLANNVCSIGSTTCTKNVASIFASAVYGSSYATSAFYGSFCASSTFPMSDITVAFHGRRRTKGKYWGSFGDKNLAGICAKNVCSFDSTICTKNVASICAKNVCSFASTICTKNVACICVKNVRSFGRTIYTKMLRAH